MPDAPFAAVPQDPRSEAARVKPLLSRTRADNPHRGRGSVPIRSRSDGLRRGWRRNAGRSDLQADIGIESAAPTESAPATGRLHGGESDFNSGESPERVGFASCATGPSESQDHGKRLLRTGPEFAQHRLAACSDEVTKDECDDDRVVELSCHWDEVRHEVEWQAEVDDEGDQQELASSWHAGIAYESRHQHDAVGDERGESTCVFATPANHQPGEEQAVERKDDPERDQKPCPPLHTARLSAVTAWLAALSSVSPRQSLGGEASQTGFDGDLVRGFTPLASASAASARVRSGGPTSSSLERGSLGLDGVCNLVRPLSPDQATTRRQKPLICSDSGKPSDGL